MQFFEYPDGNLVLSQDQITVFVDFTDDDWKSLAKYSRNINFTPGEMLINAGDVDDGVYLLVNGRVEVIGVSQGSFGRDKILAEIKEGSIFGEISFFDQQPRSAAVRALTEGNALHLSRNGFNQLTSWDPDLSRRLLLDLGKVMASRFRRAHISGV